MMKMMMLVNFQSKCATISTQSAYNYARTDITNQPSIPNFDTT